MIMFLVLNASGLTIIPISIMVYRAQLHAADPSDIFLPILISTFASTLIGIITVSIFQKINLFCKEILLYLGSITLFITGIIYGCTLLSASKLGTISSVASNLIIFSIIIIFILLALRKKINIYNSFIDGAKGGFRVAIKIIPFLIAILVSVGVFRASGAMDYLTDGMKWLFGLTGMDTRWVDAFPVALMKPLSGSGARGIMVETMQKFGADDFVGRLACTFQGAADTTFYIVAVYFGSVGIKNSRYAVTAGLIADLAGVITAIFVAYLFFG
jgi:spore maturation protein SpmB